MRRKEKGKETAMCRKDNKGKRNDERIRQYEEWKRKEKMSNEND